MHRKIVGIVQFNAVEVRDYWGPFAVFSVTRLDESRRREQPSPFQVVLVAQTEQPIVTTGGIAAGIDLAPKMVARQDGEAVARATAPCMEYRFPGSDARRVALEPR